MRFSTANGRVITIHAPHSAAGTVIFIVSPPFSPMCIPCRKQTSSATDGSCGFQVRVFAFVVRQSLCSSELCAGCLLRAVPCWLPQLYIWGRRYILSSVKRIGGNYISVDMRKVVLRPSFGVGLGRPCGCVAGLLGLAGDFTGLLVKHQRCLTTVGVAENT